MAATSEPARVAPGTISFELERFERNDGRLELRGRWFGVRGLRFVRPTLTLNFSGGDSSRALADLEHKPWAPLDGEQWEARFPCPNDALVLDAELAVATGIAIPLPPPGDELREDDPIEALPHRTDSEDHAGERGASGGKRGASAGKRGAPAGKGGAPADKGGASAGKGGASGDDRASTARAPGRARSRREPKPSPVPDELAALREETQRLRQEPIRLQAELDQSEQLRKHVEGELERLKMDADGAVARRDAAVGKFEGAAGERDEALRVRDQAVAELDAVARARDEAVAERDQARAERHEAVAERDRARADLDAAMAERDAAISERDAAASERDKAVAERTAAASERDRAVAERDEAIAERGRALSQRVATGSARAGADALRRTARAPILSEGHDQLIRRALAIAVLFAAGLALLIVLGVL